MDICPQPFDVALSRERIGLSYGKPWRCNVVNTLSADKARSAWPSVAEMERAGRGFAVATAAGALSGLLVGGIVGRLAMMLLARLAPETTGVRSDDGFLIGQFTLSGTLNLLALGTLLGVLGGGIYFVVRARCERAADHEPRSLPQ